MSARTLSDWWYRVAARRPKLRSHARLYRHQYRGEVWYLLQDPGSSRVHRFTPSARLIISLMDGSRTVAELWEIANRHLGEDAPTQDELIHLLGDLHAADLLQSDVTPDVAEIFARGEREERARYLRSYSNPMAIRIPLWDPERFLDRFRGFCGFFWSRWGAVIWCAVVFPAALLIFPHWSDLTNNFSDRVLALHNLFALYLIFPVIKAVHELGHASAIKAGGGEVHDLGLMLLVLLPVPYVEASAATVFKSKYKRAMVGAAGVAAELFIAAIAFYLWLLVEPGLLRGILFNVMIIAGISTLLFNGNPLLRYDAYYVLADLIEIPNLATRSLAYWRYLTERYLFGESDADSPLSSRVEKAWFLLYGFGSTLYRILLTFVIALFIASQFFVIGVLLAIWAIVAMVVFPVTKGIRRFLTNPRLRRHRKRMVAVVAGIVLGLGGFLASVPMPSHSNAQGILWLPDDMIVRAGANGFLTEFIVGSGARVGHGAELIRLHDSILDVRVRLAEAKVAELEAEYNAQFATDRAEAQITNERLKSELANLDLVRERAGELTVRAATDGVFIAPQMVDLPGRYIHKGDLLGYVVGDRQPLVRVVVQQHVVDKVRSATERVRARLVDHPEIALTGNVLREVPAADEYLPSLALAPEGGGEIATDPRETENPKVLQRVFQFDMELDGVEQVDYFGQRVFVRFDHQMEPLALRWYRSIRLLFLKSFNV